MTQTEELLLNNLLQSNQALLESNQKFAEQLESLQGKVAELLAQNAWLKRQLFGRKSEKLAALDPNQLSLFASPVCEDNGVEVNVGYEETFCQIHVNDCKKPSKRQNRKLLEGLPVVEEIIEPQGLYLDLYKRIGEERTRTLELEPGKLYVKEIVRPKYALKSNIELPPDGGRESLSLHYLVRLSIKVLLEPLCWPRYFYRSMNTMYPSTVRYNSFVI